MKTRDKTETRARSYYARNSRGKMVPVREVGWDSADATPTHMLVMASSGCGVAYEGTPGMEVCIPQHCRTPRAAWTKCRWHAFAAHLRVSRLYNRSATLSAGGSPWATSNVMANVMGVVKGSNAVFPTSRSVRGRCQHAWRRYCLRSPPSGAAEVCIPQHSTIIEKVQVLGLVNLKVLVAGSIYLGYNIEPIRNASNPYSKMEMGVPFSRRPKALRYDYKVALFRRPASPCRRALLTHGYCA